MRAAEQSFLCGRALFSDCVAGKGSLGKPPQADHGSSGHAAAWSTIIAHAQKHKQLPTNLLHQHMSEFFQYRIPLVVSGAGLHVSEDLHDTQVKDTTRPSMSRRNDLPRADFSAAQTFFVHKKLPKRLARHQHVHTLCLQNKRNMEDRVALCLNTFASIGSWLCYSAYTS